MLDNLDNLGGEGTPNGAGGCGMLIGPHATPGERQAFARRVSDNPRGFMIQETIRLSAGPRAGGRLASRRAASTCSPSSSYGKQPLVVPGGA